MIGNITLGQYIPGESVLHRLDPRSKIIWTALLMVAVFIINTWQEYVMMGAFVAILLVISGIPIKQSLKGIKPLMLILAITAILNIFFVQGTPLVKIGPVVISYEGLLSAIMLFFRLVMLVIVASLMTLTTTPMAMTDGIERMMKPLERVGVPAHEIAMMMSIALRFIPTLMEETERIMKAQASRGADFDTGNILKRIKSFIPVLVPLFVSAFKRADELAEAMEARCYRGSKGRTRLKQIRFTRLDLVASLAGILFLLILFGTRFLMISH
ncbi:MAG TPA: energy-coupling factor transporter transmembrane component T [Thermoclostridium caenicola]|uniref:energy-coupling factor transporter transmembrane component T family protein n=1 Tax=Thermoclostridium caenicola TaxID=659425 RepID=UPI002BD87BAD|nr:energy-coupling factor transporter transmembrane component T [Thermoclostridium caenicola]HOK42127.1 energy-coupling factor transporter transmembrane component T [Thermoclostridium caenicola]HOL84003.1 energy-coupling factor transporter transmembrane component T [Thermoclostridium caenicola]HPO75585.1 energy-coupling factor transporter transmembrane component T [Thermoclostridium caenicola]HPU21596.1 energy-coupling factor transporter transmembrane component T [Thermoclostridium caenicola]